MFVLEKKQNRWHRHLLKLSVFVINRLIANKSKIAPPKGDLFKSTCLISYFPFLIPDVSEILIVNKFFLTFKSWNRREWRLIQAGRLESTIIAIPWGVEYTLSVFDLGSKHLGFSSWTLDSKVDQEWRENTKNNGGLEKVDAYCNNITLISY